MIAIKIITMAISVLFLQSCKIGKESMEHNHITYLTECGYKNIYAVDTISIENPISFVTKGGYWVVTDKTQFYNLTSYGDDVLEQEGVFLLMSEWDLPYEMIRFVPEGEYCLESSSMLIGFPTKISAKEYHHKIDFVMLLATPNYYNEYLTGIDGPPRLKGKVKHLYIKILVPFFCNHPE